jgi:Flp pilus assembly protein TadD
MDEKIKKIVKKIMIFCQIGALLIPIVSLGCASTDGYRGIKSSYKYLIDEQIANASSKDEDSKNSNNILPMTSRDYEALGDSFYNQHNLSKAFIQYQKSLELDGSNVNAQYKSGLLYVISGFNEEAIKEFNKVVTKDPNHNLAYEGLGFACFQLKKYEEAEKNFLKAIKLNPKLWRSHNMLGVIYDYERAHRKAVRFYLHAISLKPNKGSLYNNLGVSYYLMEHYEKSEEAFQKALKYGSTDKRTYNNLGLVLSKLKRYKQAFRAFKKAGNEARAYNNLGCAYAKQGKRKEAIRSFEKALELEPGFYTIASQNLSRAKDISP